MRVAILAGILVNGAAQPGLAQQNDAARDNSVLVEVAGDDRQLVPRFNVPVNELRNMDVFGANGEQIGEIEDVLATSGGEIAAVTVEVGGFLGINERDVVIYLDSIRLDGLRLTLDMSKEEIRSLPEWEG